MASPTTAAVLEVHFQFLLVERCPIALHETEGDSVSTLYLIQG